jgi:glycosyltransferase involved in cell wall biosynthesis
MRVSHVITRLVVGGAQENTISSVVGLNRKPGVKASLISGLETGREGSLAAISDLDYILRRVPELVRPIDPLRDFLAVKKLTAMFLEEKPDIVHTHSGKAGILGRIAAHRAKVPIIIHTIHGPSFGNFQGALSNILFKTAEKRVARITTHFVAVADAMIEQYLAAGIGKPADYTKILSGFHLLPFLEAKNDLTKRGELGIGSNDFVVGMVSRLFKLKGHETLFRMASDLVKKIPDIRFLLVGDGPWRSRFEKLAADMGLSSRFIFTGLVAPAEVPSHIGMMDMLIHLSRREGLPRALPQAMAAGKPVIALDYDGAREVCRENETGFLMSPGNTSLLIDKIFQLSQNPELRHQLGLNGRNFVEACFSEQRMVDDLHNLYLRLMEQGNKGDRP